jgi:lipoprotein-anchoring transpeptidase ErfK/SrfK
LSLAASPHILITLNTQTLFLYQNETVIATYSISSSKNGAGEKINSLQTPRGLHYIRAKIGAGQPMYTHFKGRRPRGTYSLPAASINRSQDFILSRILWLCGCERGKNRLHEVDTFRRYIYIHGTHDEKNIGKPVSKGCIRMKNQDVIELFDRVAVGTWVWIQE